MAETTPPPAPRIDAAANCADPAKVVADMTIASTDWIPDARASTPKDAPNANAAMPIGATFLAPSR